ncbi:(Fe-S)-binding protein [Gynuella sp.]|uniref:(Fe-S)-binding protein n=1 Tax=Gynuella sp. TaxID=2969146 RepID=UPI003D14724E
MSLDYSSFTHVYLYGTCVVDLAFAEAGIHATEVLESLGLKVVYVEDQSCCGQPAYTSGFEQEAATVAAQQAALFPEPWPVVVLSGSCAGMMKHHYPRLLGDSAQIFSQKVIEWSEFVFNHPNFHWPDTDTVEKVVLHTSCTARREMGTFETVSRALQQAPGASVQTHVRESECCGFGGTFAVRHKEISTAMVSDKCDAILAQNPDALVSADCACMLNINGHLSWRGEALAGMHIASWVHQQLQQAGQL